MYEVVELESYWVNVESKHIRHASCLLQDIGCAGTCYLQLTDPFNIIKIALSLIVDIDPKPDVFVPNEWRVEKKIKGTYNKKQSNRVWESYSLESYFQNSQRRATATPRKMALRHTGAEKA